MDLNQLASEKKPADLDLHCFRNRIYPDSAPQVVTMILDKCSMGHSMPGTF